MSVKRASRTQGEIKRRDKQETVISSRGMFDERLNNRFIHVGVDTSRYALLIGGRSSYPPLLVKLLCLRSVCLVVYHVCVSRVLWSKFVCVDYPRHGYVLYG